MVEKISFVAAFRLPTAIVCSLLRRFFGRIIYLSFLMTLSLIQDAPCRFAALRGMAHGDWGGHLTVGFASLLSRLRSTHGYALAAAYAASLYPQLCSCRRCRGFAPPTAMLLPPPRLRSTHGYALAAAYAASLFPGLNSCRRLRLISIAEALQRWMRRGKD